MTPRLRRRADALALAPPEPTRYPFFMLRLLRLLHLVFTTVLVTYMSTQYTLRL